MKEIALITSLAVSAAIQATVVDQVIVRQQWPWSTNVKIEYKLSGVTSPVDLSVTAYDGSTALDSAAVAAAITGDRFGIRKSGVGYLILDPIKLFGTSQISIADFRISLEAVDSAENIDEVLYKIFDLTNNCACTDVKRVDLLNGKYGAVETDFGKIGEGFNTSLDDVIIWTGVTNDVAYKTTHLVMRKIPAKGKSFTMGLPEDAYYQQGTNSAPRHNVSFTNDYYAGVFELTYGQATNINNLSSTLNPLINMTYKDTTDNAMRPLTTMATAIRKDINNWPSGGRDEANTASSFVRILRNSTGLMFDLPTEAIWEYACRAGTDTDFNCGVVCTKDNTAALQNMISRNNYNSSIGASNLPDLDEMIPSDKAAAVVGSYAPNAWGLYDMHGNLTEWCLDYYQADISSFTGDDPWGADPGVTTVVARVMRGGAFYMNNQNNVSFYRSSMNANQRRSYSGVRLFIVIYD